MAEIIEVKSLGPIVNATVEVRKLTILVGPQASGKSTLAKAIYLFKSIKKIIASPYYDFINAKIASDKNIVSDIDFSKIEKHIKNQFSEKLRIWFGSDLNQDCSLKYTFNNKESIHYYRTSYGDEISFSPNFSKLIDDLAKFIENDFDKLDLSKMMPGEKDKYPSSYEKYVRSSTSKITIMNMIESYFSDQNSDLIFIPAGRGSFSILADHISSLNNDSVDELSKNFLRSIKSLVKNSFSIEELKDRINPFFSDSTINNIKEALKDSFKISDNILQGKFIHAENESRLYFSEDEFVKLNFASSGQQEAIWIILICLELIVESNDHFIVVEEPEAHLFPKAQFEIIKLLSNLISLKDVQNQILITTHSPYILSSINCMLLGGRLKDINLVNIGSEVLDKRYWIDSKEVMAYYVKGSANNIIDPEIGIIELESIDGISDEVNIIQNTLIDVYHSKQRHGL